MTDSQSPAESSPRRGQLLAIARRRFLQEGYARTSVSAIVRDAGVAQGTFYLYFDSKEQLLADLRREVFHDYLAVFERTAALPLPADERLVRTAVALFWEVERTRGLVRVFHQAATGEETERTVLAGRDRLARPLSQLLADGVASGAMQCDDPLMAAHLVLALFDNLFYEALEFDRPAPGRTVLREGQRFVLRALCVPPARIDALLLLLDQLALDPPASEPLESP